MKRGNNNDKTTHRQAVSRRDNRVTWGGNRGDDDKWSVRRTFLLIICLIVVLALFVR